MSTFKPTRHRQLNALELELLARLVESTWVGSGVELVTELDVRRDRGLNALITLISRDLITVTPHEIRANAGARRVLR